MSITLTALQKQRRDTAANWTSVNPTLLAGEIGIESDTNKWKVGTGSAAWTALAYMPGSQLSAYPIVNVDISATAEIAVSKLADGTPRQLLQTDAAGTGVEWASNIDIPGTLDVTGATTLDSTLSVPLGTAALPSIYPGTDTNTGFWSPSADAIAASTGGSERARIDSSGRLLVGRSIARTNFYNGVNTAQIQLEGTNYQNAAFAIVCNANSDDKGSLILAKNRGATVGSNTVVQDGDDLGSIEFLGSDGTEFVQAASIKAEVDGTPGANDMPGRLVMSVTLDGASSPTEALRITNDRVVAYNQAAPAAVNTTTTITAANLKTGIITSTTAAAVTMTLPTGTDIEAGFSGIYTNMTFEFSVINTGPNTLTVGANGNTTVGSLTVATLTSARYALRRTGANAFTLYRLS